MYVYARDGKRKRWQLWTSQVARLRVELQQSIGDPGNTHSTPRNICGSAGTGEQETGIHIWFAVEREMRH